MKTIITAVLLFIAVKLKSQTYTFGRVNLIIDDGVKHVYAGQLICSFTSYTAYYITDRPIISGAIGIAATFIAVGLKEAYDKNTPGHVSSFRDFGNTAWGGAIQIPVYTAVVTLTDHKHKWNHPDKSALDAQYGDIANLNPLKP